MSNIDYIINEDKGRPVDFSIGSNGMNIDMQEPVYDGLGVGCEAKVAEDSKDLEEKCVKAIALGHSARSVIASARKAGVKLPEALKELIGKLDGVLGNYVVSCRFSPDANGNYRGFVKYAIDCDCEDNGGEATEEITDGGIDGFFNPKYIKVSRRKVCSRTGLPVLASLDDIGEDDKKELFAKVVKVYPEVMRVKDMFDAAKGPEAVQMLFLSIGKEEPQLVPSEGAPLSMGNKATVAMDGVTPEPDFCNVSVKPLRGSSFELNPEFKDNLQISAGRCPMDF